MDKGKRTIVTECRKQLNDIIEGSLGKRVVEMEKEVRV